MKMRIIKFFYSSNRFVYRWFIGVIGLTKDRTTRNLFLLFQTASITVVAVLFIDFISIMVDQESSFGTFGDFFGGIVNPILTFLMFMGLLITIVLQQKEFRLTREESKRSADALEKSKNEAELQTKILLRNTQKSDAFNFLNESRKDLEKILSEKSPTTPIDNETKWQSLYRFYEDNLKSLTNISHIASNLTLWADSQNLDFEKLSRSLELYYVSLNELAKLEVNHIIISNYKTLYDDHVGILKMMGCFDPDAYTDVSIFIKRNSQIDGM